MSAPGDALEGAVLETIGQLGGGRRVRVAVPRKEAPRSCSPTPRSSFSDFIAGISTSVPEITVSGASISPTHRSASPRIASELYTATRRVATPVSSTQASLSSRSDSPVVTSAFAPTHAAKAPHYKSSLVSFDPYAHAHPKVSCMQPSYDVHRSLEMSAIGPVTLPSKDSFTFDAEATQPGDWVDLRSYAEKQKLEKALQEESHARYRRRIQQEKRQQEEKILNLQEELAKTQAKLSLAERQRQDQHLTSYLPTTTAKRGGEGDDQVRQLQQQMQHIIPMLSEMNRKIQDVEKMRCPELLAPPKDGFQPLRVAQEDEVAGHVHGTLREMAAVHCGEQELRRALSSRDEYSRKLQECEEELRTARVAKESAETNAARQREAAEEEKAALHRQLAALEEEKGELIARARESEEKNDALQAALGAREEKLREVRRKLEQLEGERETLREEVRDAEEAREQQRGVLDSLQRRLRDAEDKARRSVAECGALELQLASREAEATRLATSEGEQKALREQLEYAQGVLREMAKERETVKDRLAACERELEGTVRECDDLRDKLSKADNKGTDLRRNCTELERKVSSAEAQLSRARAEAEDLQRDLLAAREKVAQLTSAKETMWVELNEERSEVERDLTRKLAAAEAKLSHLEDDRQETAGRAAHLEGKLSQALALRDQSVAEVQKVKAELDDSRARLHTSQAEVDRLRRSLATATETGDKVAQLHEEIDSQCHKLRVKDEEVARLQDEIDSLSRKLKNRDEEIQSLKEENREAARQVQYAAERAELHKDEVRQLQQKADRYRVKADGATEETNKLRVEIGKLEGRLSMADQDLERAKAVQDTSAQQLREAQKESALAHDREAATNERIEALSKSASESAAQVALMRQQLRAREEALDEAREALRVKEAEVAEARRLEDDMCHLRTSVDASRREAVRLRERVASLEKDLDTAKADLQMAREQNEKLKSVTEHENSMQSNLIHVIDDISARYYRERHQRRKLYNQLVELRGNIRVVCRLRPTPNQQIALAAESEGVTVTLKNGKTRDFTFDAVMKQKESQAHVFAHSAEDLVQSVIDGYNVCIMAYGQTGSGKTYTMFGDCGEPPRLEHLVAGESRGVVPRSLECFWEKVGELAENSTTKVSLSMVELYCGDVRDLLQGATTLECTTQRYMMGTEVITHRLVSVGNLQDCYALISQGYRARSQSSTLCNAHSSRSHCVVTLHFQSRLDNTRLSNTGEIKEVSSRMVLVDLGGSECVTKAGIEGEQVRESSFINKSLSALSDVLQSLSHGKAHIPYRNSKLTLLLSDCLGGDAKMLLFININPNAEHLTETLQSLSFGHRARQIKRGAAPRHVAVLAPPKAISYSPSRDHVEAP